MRISLKEKSKWRENYFWSHARFKVKCCETFRELKKISHNFVHFRSPLISANLFCKRVDVILNSPNLPVKYCITLQTVPVKIRPHSQRFVFSRLRLEGNSREENIVTSSYSRIRCEVRWWLGRGIQM
jgi:hypothetical protein